ncbi:hypothetical protein [Anseongella ginsenosidimutans]|uniref:hypothetical protein n=1 Tax=Anseongella ginsenosidimutans TaxID=496056 RepID=UPI0013153EAF|nr:hypothetical protein [Anseongella ginsenosidimutans]
MNGPLIKYQQKLVDEVNNDFHRFPATALERPGGIVLTEKLAEKLFGPMNP